MAYKESDIWRENLISFLSKWIHEYENGGVVLTVVNGHGGSETPRLEHHRDQHFYAVVSCRVLVVLVGASNSASTVDQPIAASRHFSKVWGEMFC